MHSADNQAVGAVAVAETEDLPPLPMNQARAMAELLLQPSIREAARAAGVGERTLRGWRVEDPLFAKHLQNGRREVFSRLAEALEIYAPRAEEHLREVMRSPEVSAKARYTASRTLLEMGFQASEQQLVLEPEEQQQADSEHEAIRKACEGSARRSAPVKPKMLPLTEPQERAIEALAVHPTLAAAAKAASIGLRTLQAWLNDHANFQRHYEDVRKELAQQTLQSAREMLPEAIEVIYSIACDESLSINLRMAADRTLVVYRRRAMELLSNSDTIETRHEAALATERKRRAASKLAHPHG